MFWSFSTANHTKLKDKERFMKKSITLVAVLARVCGLMSVGFECSSAELTSAKLYIQRSDWKSAEKSLTTELEKNPDNGEAWYLLGQVRSEMKDYRGMNEAFNKALSFSKEHEKDITNTRLLKWEKAINSGVEHFNKGKENPDEYSQAAELFEGAIELLPDSVHPYKNLTYCYINLNTPEKAIPTLEKGIKSTKNVQCAELLAKIYYQRAMESYEKFESPANKREVKIGMSKEEVRAIWENPVSTNTSKPKNRKVVVDQYTYNNPPLTMTFENNQLVSWEESGQKFMLGSKQFNIDSTGFRNAQPLFDKTITVVREGMKIDPTNAELFVILSDALIASGRNEEAEKTYVDGIKKEPQNKFYRYNYGVLLLKKDLFPEAIAELKKAIEIDSNYESAVYNLASAHINWGVKLRKEAGEDQKKIADAKAHFSEAIPHLQKVIKLRPDNADMYEVLGRIQTNLGMSKEAEAAFVKADEIRKKK
jgi:tetratricopeptide (TPR) repeat protein